MGEPRIAASSPAVLELEAGTYFWCRCGHSAGQPWCDGSHEGSGTGLLPLEWTLAERKKVAVCRCKHTGRPPLCDGAHKKLG